MRAITITSVMNEPGSVAPGHWMAFYLRYLETHEDWFAPEDILNEQLIHIFDFFQSFLLITTVLRSSPHNAGVQFIHR